MSSHIEFNAIANQLTHAATVALRLAEQDITVHAAIANGRRPVLVIDRMPPGIDGVAKRISPSPLGGQDIVVAAPYHGCQLECLYHDKLPEPMQPHLQVVGRG